MITIVRSGPVGFGVSWRLLEFAGCAVALFIFSGAFLPLILSGGGDLDDSARSILRTLQLPAYAVTLLLVVPHADEIFRVARRNVAFTALVMLPFASVLWSIGPSVTLRRAIAFFFSMLLAYLLAARFTSRQLLLMVAGVLGLCMVFSLAFYVALPGLGHMPMSGEARGVFLHKNVLGWYAAVATIVFAGLAFDATPKVAKVGRAMSLVSFGCLILSGSATGLFVVVTAAGLAVFYNAYARRRGLSRLLLLLLFLQFVAVFLLVAVPLSVYVLEAVGKDATLTGRIPLWAEVDPYIAERWLAGYGFAAFWDQGSGRAWTIWSIVGWQAPHSHNGARDVLLSLGVIGLGLLILVVLRGLKQGLVLLTAGSGRSWLWLNLYVALFLTMNLTESLYLAQNETLFVLFGTALLMFSDRAAVLRAERSAGGAPRPATV